MAINNIVLRSVSHPPLTTKGSELTFTDLDGNFIEIYDYLVAINTGGGVPAFNMGTTYTGTNFVTYSGKIWMHISAVPTTGSIPGTNPAVWQEVTIGAIAHAPNTDTSIGKGTPYETTAQDIFEAIMEPIETVTEDQLVALMASDNLYPGKRYKVTDSIAWGDILVEATTVNTFSQWGKVLAMVPNPAETGGGYVWNPFASYASGVQVGWHGFVYKNLVGGNDAALPPPDDATNWELKTDTNLYMEVTIDCQLSFDGANVGLVSFYDASRQNVLSAVGATYLPVVTIANEKNTSDQLSDVLDMAGLVGPVTTNTFINSELDFPEGGDVTIRGNRCTNSVIKSVTAGQGTIQDCTLQNVELNFIDGMGSGTNLEGCEFSFPVLTTLKVRDDVSTVVGGKVSPDGSTIEDTIDLTGTDILDLTLNGHCDIYGTILVTSSNTAENLEEIHNGTHLFPLKIQPATGLTITVKLTDISGGAIPKVIIGNGGTNFDLKGDLQEYMIVEPVDFTGGELWRVTKIVTS